MKVVAKKRYYEEDLYSVLRHGRCITKENLKDYADHIRKLAKIEHRKGDFKDYEVKAERFCCEDLKEIGKVQAEDYYPSYGDRKWCIGVFLPFQGWDEPDDTLINYCPFCGEKIEVVEEE